MDHETFKIRREDAAAGCVQKTLLETQRQVMEQVTRLQQCRFELHALRQSLQLPPDMWRMEEKGHALKIPQSHSRGWRVSG